MIKESSPDDIIQSMCCPYFSKRTGETVSKNSKRNYTDQQGADNENSSLKTMSCCSIANDLRHDSAAIYVHLEPLMEKVKTLMPTIRHVSFLSDGPSTQYRNKKMFFLMVEHISKTLSVQSFIWHFSERRHIKVAPDGVGECLKRTTDTLVGQGRDIHNFETFVNELNKNIRKIKIHAIDPTKLFAIDKILPEDLATFKGTMNIHELVWTNEKPSIL
ncbi:hypothetical protein ILUMI_14251 [Ignelater luminosus]|uniref:Uncharacterized protein n=1 Tax=Ignelater luminosus TaxID=2038154 RepID=A0A8K0CUK9_IGNLU|nr:hypothetical protein ILUMI_14251 [Ignelater luminosus]